MYRPPQSQSQSPGLTTSRFFIPVLYPVPGNTSNFPDISGSPCYPGTASGRIARGGCLFRGAVPPASYSSLRPQRSPASNHNRAEGVSQ